MALGIEDCIAELVRTVLPLAPGDRLEEPVASFMAIFVDQSRTVLADAVVELAFQGGMGGKIDEQAERAGRKRKGERAHARDPIRGAADHHSTGCIR